MYCLRLRRLVLIFVNPPYSAAGADFTSARSERNRVCVFCRLYNPWFAMPSNTLPSKCCKNANLKNFK
ncbi:hypothetical protein EWP17_12015 [Neisseria meningitidis]|nr:hypothetical protein [Neisseria meningitidis]MCI3162920.1 hypothetical protein [Neisseria meningitidis]